MIKRKTAMEFDVIKQLFSEDEEQYLNKIICDSKFQERILLNSESLYNKLKKIIDSDKKIDNKTKKTLVKYLLRMTSRPQPNRLNSGISLNQANNNEQKQIKKVEISLEWEQEIVKKVEKSILKTSSNVKLVLNPKLYKKNQQYLLEKYMTNNTSYIYIEDSNFLNILFEVLRKPISLKSILNHFGKGQDSQLILDVIQKLITTDIIKTELSSTSINRDSDDFIERLQSFSSDNQELISKLEDIKNSLEMYRNAKIGEGIYLYKDLIKKMSSLCKSSSYIIVDLYIYDAMSEKKQILNQVNFDDSLEIMNYFDKLQTFDWDKYYNSFAGKYGFYTKVPLLQMIDRDEGIGLPQHLHLNNKNEETEQYLLNRIMQNSLENEEVLKLTSTDYTSIRDIYGYEGERRIPISYDCKIVPYQGKFILPPNAFSYPRNSFTGRFSFPEKEKDGINKSKYSEINYISNYFKDIGLTHKSESDIFIDCIGKTDYSMDRVPLNEIDLIAHDDRLHMIYKNEVIYPVSTHLLSYRNFNEHPALIFLNEFYMYCFEYPSNFPVEKFSYLEFIPRIEYKDFILSPARINIKFQKESTKEERINKINSMINKYNLKRYKYIYFLEWDKNLPVPTNNDLAIDFLESCKRNTGEEYSLTLMEAPELENIKREVNDWIYSSGDKKFEEEKHGYNNIKKSLEVSKDFIDELDPNISSYYLYYRSGKREKIGTTILKLSKYLSLEDVFLVNFIDESKKENIRLRYVKDNKKDIELEKELAAMVISGDLYDFKKTLFYPEINRYGGKKIYKTVYRLFSVDTSSIETFKGLYANYNETEKALYLSCYTLFGLLGSDLNLLYDYLEISIKKDLKYVKPFAKRRNEYRDIALKSLEDYKGNSNSLLMEHNSLSNEILNLVKKETLSKEELFYLVQSIIHMSMNRHFPFKRELEQEVNQFMRFVFSNINYNLRRMG